MQAVLGSVIGPKKEIHDLTGRTAVITGGSRGIGAEVALAFAKVGAKVILVSRREDGILEKFKEQTNGEADVEFVDCDLGNLKQVKEVFGGLRAKLDRLDLLILSAGINTNQYDTDADGIDRHFGVNWLGNYYATNQLYPLIRKTSKIPDAPAPRIIFESSEMHRTAPSDIHFDSLAEINNPELGPTQLYGRSKLAMILGVKYGLVERVIKPNGDNVFAIAVHPGAVNTDMQEQWKSAYPGLTGKLLTQAMLAIGRSPEQGSFSALYAATSPEIEEKNWNGVYLSDPGQLGKETSQASDPALGAALWNLSEQIIHEKVGKDGLASWSS